MYFVSIQGTNQQQSTPINILWHNVEIKWFTILFYLRSSFLNQKISSYYFLILLAIFSSAYFLSAFWRSFVMLFTYIYFVMLFTYIYLLAWFGLWCLASFDRVWVKQVECCRCLLTSSSLINISQSLLIHDPHFIVKNCLRTPFHNQNFPMDSWWKTI